MKWYNMNKLFLFDRDYGKTVIGVDEAGRGPLAGSVIASAVYIPDYEEDFLEINDSKKLSEKKRNFLYDVIMNKCYVGIGEATASEIDDINILNATFLAMKRAIANLKENIKQLDIEIELVLVDGNHKIRDYSEYKQEEIIKGDSKSLSIAAASIIAKVTRDRQMEKIHKMYPEYMFYKHKGYGTKLHREKLLIHGGVSGIHRKSFLKKIFENKDKNRDMIKKENELRLF